jgi:hypothetical protein
MFFYASYKKVIFTLPQIKRMQQIVLQRGEKEVRSRISANSIQADDCGYLSASVAERDSIEWLLSMGANRWEATDTMIKRAVKTCKIMRV